MRSIFRFAAAAALLALPGAAWADGWRIAAPQDTASSGFSLDLEGGQQWQELPKWQTGNQGPGSAAPFFSATPTVDGGQASLALGYRPAQGWLGWGRNERLELSGGFFDLDAHDRQSFANPNVAALWEPVGGPAASTDGNTFGVFSSDLTTHYYGGELALRAATDLDMAPGLTLTPAAAIFGGLSHVAYDYTDVEGCNTFLGSGCFNDTINERVQSRAIGLMLSAGARQALGRGFSLLAGAAAGVVGIHSALRADDCFDENPGVAGCQPFAGDATHAIRTRDDAGARLAGELGLRYQIGPATVDLLGNVRFDSAVPAVRNPSSGTQSVQLGSSSEIGYGIALRASFPLGPAR